MLDDGEGKQAADAFLTNWVYHHRSAWPIFPLGSR